MPVAKRALRPNVETALIREALTNNYDLRTAATRVEQARAVAMQARSQFVPSINYNGTVSRGRNELLGNAIPNGGATGSAVAGTLNAFGISNTTSGVPIAQPSV